jgi:hypothetical protein
MAVHLTGIYRRGAEDAEKTQDIHRKDAKRAKKNTRVNIRHDSRKIENYYRIFIEQKQIRSG